MKTLITPNIETKHSRILKGFFGYYFTRPEALLSLAKLTSYISEPNWATIRPIHPIRDLLWSPHIINDLQWEILNDNINTTL